MEKENRVSFFLSNTLSSKMMQSMLNKNLLKSSSNDFPALDFLLLLTELAIL